MPAGSQDRFISVSHPDRTEAFSLTLETLRLLHSAASTRWSNRRDYEWKLSYAVWTLLAGYTAAVVLGKDSNFQGIQWSGHTLASWAVAGCLALVVAIHWFYLDGMVARTINDLFLVDDVEKAILLVDPWVQQHVPKTHLNSTFLQKRGNNVRYGLYAQVSITLLLALIAAWFTFREKNLPTRPAQPSARFIVL